MPHGQTLFEHPWNVTDAWENASVYTLYLKTGEVKKAAARAAPASLHTAAGGAAAFAPNLVVTRDPQGDRDLERFVEEGRKAMATKLPPAKLLRESKTTLAGLPAHEREYQITLDAPAPVLVQWHAATLRDGWFYGFCGTSTKDRFEKDKKEFRALVDSWRGR